MRNPIAALWRGRNGKFVLLALGFHTFLQQVVPDRLLIDIDNALAVASAGGVLIAFAPSAWDALTRKETTGAETLIAGIFVHFFGTFWSRVANIAARNFGYDIGGSDWVSGYLIFMIIGAVQHLNSPHIVNERVPPKQWRRIGIVTAIGIAIGTLIILRAPGTIHP